MILFWFFSKKGLCFYITKACWLKKVWLFIPCQDTSSDFVTHIAVLWQLETFIWWTVSLASHGAEDEELWEKTTFRQNRTNVGCFWQHALCVEPWRGFYRLRIMTELLYTIVRDNYWRNDTSTDKKGWKSSHISTWSIPTVRRTTGLIEAMLEMLKGHFFLQR